MKPNVIDPLPEKAKKMSFEELLVFMFRERKSDEKKSKDKKAKTKEQKE